MTHPTTPQAGFFGPAEAGLFGWLHAAPPGIDARLGLVICNPFGFEEVCAHRSLRQLAAAAAGAGVPALRFDYLGTGNAQGDELEPDLPAAWVRSVHQAIDHLKASTGVARVALLGVRLGAALATLAAAERDDIAGLIAFAPVVKGRDYLRELRMLGRATAADAPAGPGSGAVGLESAGFVMSADTVDALGRLNLHALPQRPAPQALIVERDDLPASTRWRADLERLGTQVRVEAWPGYAALMTNPQDAVVPQRLIVGVLATLADWQSDLPAARSAAPAAPSVASMAAHRGHGAIAESVVQIPAGHHALFGILTRAAGTSKRPGVLMLNSGSVHHIGPNRLWVTLARRWAARGVPVLRIDLSGLADSPARAGEPDNQVYSASAAPDIAAALRYLSEACGTGDCHVVGLCSGAFHALQAVLAGERVASALMINPLTYNWADCNRLGEGLNDYELLENARRYRRELLSLKVWSRLVRGQLDLAMITRVVTGRARQAAEQGALRLRRALGIAPGNDLARALARLPSQGARLRFVFADGEPGLELLQRHGGRALRQLQAQGQLSISLMDEGDHTFTGAAARGQLVTQLDELLWADVRAAVDAADTSAAAAPSWLAPLVP